jgi:hypothetical protein
MAKWCFDPVATALSGRVEFRLPYPQANWREERRWNGFLLEAMRTVTEAYRIFSKPAEQWDAEENLFYVNMLKGLKTADGK